MTDRKSKSILTIQGYSQSLLQPLVGFRHFRSDITIRFIAMTPLVI